MFGYPFSDLPAQISFLGLRDTSDFVTILRCYPIEAKDEGSATGGMDGGKLILPMSALQRLMASNLDYPMIFKVTNIALEKSTHAGVLEFTAEEGAAYMPKWILNTLSLERDDLVRVERVKLPQGRFVKIQPQSADFLEITDPKAVLENALVNFSTLSIGDRILFDYNFKTYEILVLEIGPEGPGISIIETDLEVDFAPPVGYVPPEPPLNSLEESKKQSAIKIKKLASPGTSSTKTKRPGVRICGRKTRRSAVREKKAEEASKEDDVDPESTINLSEGQLFFGYPVIPYTGSSEGSPSNLNEPASAC